MLKMSIAVDSQRLRGASPPIAVRFGVSSRTIRDIWNRKTWAFATKHLWHLESNCPDASMQVIVLALYIFWELVLILCLGSSLYPTAWSAERFKGLEAKNQASQTVSSVLKKSRCIEEA